MSESTQTTHTTDVQMSVSVVAGAVLVMFLWALCFPLIKTGLSNSPPMAFAAMRAALSGVALLLVAQWLHRPAISGKSTWGGIVVIGISATSLGFFGMFYGGGRVSPGLATVVANTQPLIAAALGLFFLNERLTVTQRWGMAAGFGGILLISVPGVSATDSQGIGVIYILLGAVGIAVSNIALKRLSGRVDIMRAMGWQLMIGAVPLAALAVTTEDVFSVAWSVSFMIVLFTLSVFGTAAAFVLWFALLRHSTLNQLNAFTFLTPILGMLMGVLFFNEELYGPALAGIILSLLGIYIMNRQATRIRVHYFECVISRSK